MEVVEFMRQMKRMCDYYGDVSCVCDDSRETCPALNIDCSLGIPTSEQLVATVEKWAKEHPDKQEQGQQKPELEKMSIVNNVKVYGLGDSIRASKYPMAPDINICNDNITDTVRNLGSCEAGSGHDQFLTGIIVQFDLTFSVKAWTEAERYHFFDFVSSQSTMHCITKFDLDKSYNEYVDQRIVEIMKEKVADFNKETEPVMRGQKYLEILYSNPCGFRLTARMTTNYRQLKTIYHQRKSHRLPEWREFCGFIETLPYFKELVFGG